MANTSASVVAVGASPVDLSDSTLGSGLFNIICNNSVVLAQLLFKLVPYILLLITI